MKEIRVNNGKKMEKLMEAVGETGARIKKEGNWDLSVYIAERGKNFVRIEMCESKTIGGDLFMDPFMEIILKKKGEGHITGAVPVAYQSDNIFIGRTDINKKGEIFLNRELQETKEGELDRRLEEWLHSIELLGYLEKPNEILFHTQSTP